MLEEMMRKMDEYDMEEFDTLDSSEKTIAILGDRWWSQAVKKERVKTRKTIQYNTRKQRNERPTVQGVSVRTRNGAPSRK